MALNYSKIDIRGVVIEEIMEELIFMNNTLGKDYVSVNTDIKANTNITEASATAVMSAYTSGAKSATGSIAAFDYAITPVKVQYYDEYDPETLRFSRFKRDMAPGAFNILSNEFERLLIGGVYAKEQSADLESKYWSNITSTTKSAIASAGTASGYSTVELAKVAALPTGLFDGVYAKALYNDINSTLTAGRGTYNQVTGTVSCSATTVKQILDAIYASVTLNVPGYVDGTLATAHIFVPRSWRGFINQYNNNPANFKDAFEKVGEGMDAEFYFNGLRICFVPLPENTAYVHAHKFLSWNTDLVSDETFIESDVIANNRKDRFYWSVMTVIPHISKQGYGVVYTF